MKGLDFTEKQRQRLEQVEHRLGDVIGALHRSVFVSIGDVIDVDHEAGFLRGHGTQLVDGQLLATVCGVVERVNKLVSVRSLKTRYSPEIGDVVVGRVTKIAQKRWRVDVYSRQHASLMLSAVNLPGGVQVPANICLSVQIPVQTVFSQPLLQPAVSHLVQQVQRPVPQVPQPGVAQVPGQEQWVPKTAIASPKPFSGDKKGEDLDTWLRTVSVYVKCKLTLPHEEVLVAASYLEGSAARWLSGYLQLQGYGHDFHAWAVTHNDFIKVVEERWHDPQEAQKATDDILTLSSRKFRSERDATDVIERPIYFLGVHYDPLVLLTTYLRCLPIKLRNQLASEAMITVHNFPSFSKKALDLEAKIGHGYQPTTDGRK
ncbi:hypothetical protein CBR_g31324 [Chara braunii]|uniref:RRP4 S1 domain-containing protein n=1 Tax=Chara braunii TaxID=69332 RepID=A0A388LEM9_CHABU|nr:hypothetical protein CBR_g31324 [Chara braunii]|eukprot:GBG80770.1 hypothetical protein CBR_g31324 [Chara braunii]